MRPRFKEPQRHEEPDLITSCGRCNQDIYEGEHAHGFDGELYHDVCWSERAHDYVDYQEVDGCEEEQVCIYCGDGFDEGHTVHKNWDGDICCYECLFMEVYFDSEYTLD